MALRELVDNRCALNIAKRLSLTKEVAMKGLADITDDTPKPPSSSFQAATCRTPDFAAKPLEADWWSNGRRRTLRRWATSERYATRRQHAGRRPTQGPQVRRRRRARARRTIIWPTAKPGGLARARLPTAPRWRAPRVP